MSIVVRDSGDIYFDGTNNVSVMSIFVDSAADLSGLVQYEDIHFQLGSDALDVSTGNKYRMLSNGTWVLQPDNVWQNVYTKAEIDDIVADIDAYDAKQTLALARLINESGKNKVKPTVTTQTVNGITWTVNADGTITANGTATANSYVTIQVFDADSVFDGNYHLSGCPSGGGSAKYALYMARGNYTVYDYGSGAVLPYRDDGLNKNLIAIVYSGQTVTDLTFKPMICRRVYWDITQAYVPYCPTLPELYAMM